MQTKRLSRGASEQELRKAHMVKMTAKKLFRERIHLEFRDAGYISANLGVNHPDYGLSMKDHLAEKTKRDNQK